MPRYAGAGVIPDRLQPLLDEARPIAELVRGSADWRVVYDADHAIVAERTAP